MSAPSNALASAVCAVILAACAAPPRQLPPPPLAPAKLFEGGYINVRSPNADGWRLIGSSPRGMGFAKPGPAAGETHGAQVLMFDLRPTETPDQFADLIRQSVEKDTD